MASIVVTNVISLLAHHPSDAGDGGKARRQAIGTRRHITLPAAPHLSLNPNGSRVPPLGREHAPAHTERRHWPLGCGLVG